MARSLSLSVILCVFALRMRTTSQQTCSMTSVVPMVDTSSPSTANQIVASCTTVGPSDPISNPVWYLNGVDMNESRCLRGSTRSPSTHQLTFTITPDCEGYLQCGIQATCAVSRPRPVYAYPVRTPGTLTNPRTMGAVLGTDVVIPCYFVVSSLGNTKACWTFRSELGDEIDLNCTTGPTYNLPISSVTSANAGKYFCKVTADKLPDRSRAIENAPITTLEVVEPARAEGIKVSVNGDRYMFSVLSPSGSGLRYTWFQNDTVTSSTTGSLTVPNLPRGTTRVKVSISNHIESDVMFMDSSSTMFTDNVTIEVTHPPLQCASPISTVLASPLVVPMPSTDTGTIVLIVVLVLITVFAFTVIFVLLAVTFYLATELKNVRQERNQLRRDKEQLQQVREQLQQERNQLRRDKEQLQQERDQLRQDKDQLKTQYEKEVAVLNHQISQSSNISDEPDSKMASSCTNVAKQLTRIVKEIVEECPESLTPIFCLKTVRVIVDCLTENVNCNNKQFKEVMRNIRRNARKLYDVFVDKKKQEQEQSKNLSERSAAVDGDDDEGGFTGMLAEYQWSLGRLDDKLRELGVEVKDWVQDGQVQKAVDLEEDDL